MHQFSGVADYPGGYTEPRYAFQEKLAVPLQAQSLRVPAAAPPAGAITLGAEWGLILEGPVCEQTGMAVADFRQFMAVCMEAPLGTQHAAPALTLNLEWGSGPAEGYTLAVTPEGITITAADESGLQYALYELEERMTEAGGPWLLAGTVTRQPFLETRILRSFYSPYYANELLSDTDYYPEEYLNRLAHQRINGIWIHVQLREIVPSEIFPEFGADSPRILTAMRKLIRKAGRYGIRVFVYLLEPRGFPQDDPFWERHPEVRGAPAPNPRGWPGTDALCTSVPQVRDWLRESCRQLFAGAPGLGGAFMITASEAQTNCYSHYPTLPEESKDNMEEHYRTVREGCPRCLERTPEDVVTEVLATLEAGIHAAAPEAKVLAWDWSWEMLWGAETADKLVGSLPKGVILMCDFERGDHKTVLGKDLWIDEYSLSFVGPSARFRRFARIAAAHGTPQYAKMQFVNTHELASVPYLPLPGIVYDKFSGLRSEGVQGMLGCWIFGNYPGLITDIAASQYFGAGGDKAHMLERLATRYFDAAAAPEVLAAWEEFATAWSFFPFNIPLIYDGAMTQGPAFPWFLEPIHEKFPGNWLPNQPVGDNMLYQIPDGEVLWFDACLAALLEHWAAGVRHLESAVGAMSAPPLSALQEYGLTRCVYHQMTTLRNTFRFYVKREFLLRSPDEAERRAILGRLQGYVRDEIANAEAVLPFVEADTRLGWHSEADTYQFDPDTIRARVADLRKMAEDTIPAWLAAGTGLVSPVPYAEPLSDAIYELIREKLGDAQVEKGIFEG